MKETGKTGDIEIPVMRSSASGVYQFLMVDYNTDSKLAEIRR